MNSGFWLASAVLAGGVVVAAAMLPNTARVSQVERSDDDDLTDPDIDVDIDFDFDGQLVPAFVPVARD